MGEHRLAGAGDGRPIRRLSLCRGNTRGHASPMQSRERLPPGCENADIENLPPDPVPTSTSPTTLETNVSTAPKFTG